MCSSTLDSEKKKVLFDMWKDGEKVAKGAPVRGVPDLKLDSS